MRLRRIRNRRVMGGCRELGHHQEMRARTEKRRLRLGRTGCEEDRITGRRVIPALKDVREPACDAFDAEDLKALEPGVRGFLGQLRGVMEVGGREPLWPSVWVPMLAVK